jgi:5-methylcytosine-specific restriction endonuclease McrA
MLAKPEPLRRVKARKKRQAIKARATCRLDVLQRDGWCCVRCGVPVNGGHPEWHPRRAHINEIVPRSKGGSPTDPDNCELLCQSCHMPNGRHAPTAERQAILEGRAKGKT